MGSRPKKRLPELFAWSSFPIGRKLRVTRLKMLCSCHVCQLASGASLVFLAHGSGHGLLACRKGLRQQVWAEGKKDLPKKSANTVHVMVMTLYGIEKSGVGHWSKTESPNSTTTTSSLCLSWADWGERSDAAHPIPSFACSSLRCACQHIMDAKHSPHTVLHHNAMSGACSRPPPVTYSRRKYTHCADALKRGGSVTIESVITPASVCTSPSHPPPR